ncbi:hypothetical protein niasHT_004589 [Heterodera trifolii]|uniref:Uncharacterized protein n=1 Tax=Heterodera trifolii TaxID=157864 RepID=A0ABD2M8N4_9BILA
MSNCYFVVIFALFVFVAVLDAKKPIVQQNNQQQQRTVAEPKKQPQKVAEAEELPQQTKQPQQQQQEESPTPQCVQQQKVRKPKSLKALTEYELCKQECRRKRDQESANEYIDYLREELRLAEERVEAEALQQQQQLQYANGL